MTSPVTARMGTRQEVGQKDPRNWIASLRSVNFASKRRSTYGKSTQYDPKAYKQSFENLVMVETHDKPITYATVYSKIIEIHRPDIRKTRMLNAAETAEDIIRTLDSLGFNEIAERLTYLQKVVEEEEGEGGEPIEFQSLKNFSIFVVRRQILPMPQIGITLEGLIHAVWDPPGIGTLVMNFLKSGDIAFTGLYRQHAPKSRRRRISGELPSDVVMRYLQDFMHTSMSK